MPVWICERCHESKPMVCFSKTRNGLYLHICLTCKPLTPTTRHRKKTKRDRSPVLRTAAADPSILKASKRKKAYADELRRRMTPAEERLWECLKTNGQWKAQCVVAGYIPDFFNHTHMVAIEIDGAIHDTFAQKLRDARKDYHLRRKGVRVLRYSNREVFTCLDVILRELSRFQ